ncbi:hypothetical protein JCGZ_07853 [Jatropha curcas]|uniref:Uncharacterized protein n=1 Tax=Jatropha curcas TaxID=180498 RepID=A0A067KRN2_JATCU|nr:hypothetical protein JCGZ_07853 [Jatropha curcas]
MPLKQKARKKNDGSSSSVPTKKDWASKYKALFPIYTTEKGECFKCLMKSSYTDSKLKIPENANISLEFVTSLEWVDEKQNAIKFRVEGEELTLDYDKIHQWLGFAKTGFASCEPSPEGKTMLE